MSVVKLANKRGFPCLKATGVTLVGTVATFTFPNYTNIPSNFSGGMWVNLPYTTPSTATSIQFSFAGKIPAKTVVTYDGVSVTSTEMPGQGIFLVFYDQESDTLQLI